MEENGVDWIAALQLFPFVIAGLLVHLLDKLHSARQLSGYTWRGFCMRNILGYISSIIVCFVGIVLLADGMELMPGVNRIALSFAIGVGGGSLVRSFITKNIK